MSNTLNQIIYKLKRPCIFKNILNESGSAFKWTPENLAALLKDNKIKFRMGKMNKSNLQFENECEFIEAKIEQFIQWKAGIIEADSPFGLFNRKEYWAYADYKYMIELVNDGTIEDNSIDWKRFGFEKRNSKDSTLWLGTKGSYTPCHYDTYGYNLVAQVYGSKRWIMFPKENTSCMYPTRIPFEESTVYSQINIQHPNLERFPNFKKSNPYVVDLIPGDVLYVPHNWWHYVYNLSDSISINSWVDLELEDNFSRLKEITSKTLIQSVMDSNLISFDKWINSSEDYNSQEENLDILLESLNNIQLINNNEEIDDKELFDQVKKHHQYLNIVEEIGFDDYLKKYTTHKHLQEYSNEECSMSCDNNELDLLNDLANAVTHPNVINQIIENLINNHKLKNSN